MTINLVLNNDLAIDYANKWIYVLISPETDNVVEMKSDGLYLPSTGLVDMGPIPNQGGDGLRVGYKGPFDYGTSSNPYPQSGRISLNNYIHRKFIRANGSITNYDQRDCILPGDFVVVMTDNVQTDLLVITQVTEGAQSDGYLQNSIHTAYSLITGNKVIDNGSDV